jgi:hypothetical protein
VPESRVRKKAAYTPPAKASGVPRKSPSWYAPLMCALFVLGLAYVVIFYVSGSQYPISAIGPWNVVVGFGVIMAGFGMATRWR